MRIAAVALVLIVGAAVVLAFANTLNSWVLGGLLGGLAAILLSIPISLSLFSLLARRHEARQHEMEASLVDEANFVNEIDDRVVVYESDGYVHYSEDDFSPDPRSRVHAVRPRPPVSGYLALPPVEEELDEYEDDDAQTLMRREPRNYPRLPRHIAHSLPQDDELSSPPSTRSYRNPSTRSLAEHQSAALRQARQEARRLRTSSDMRSRRAQETRTPPSLRPRSSGQARTQRPGAGSRRPGDDYPSQRAARGNQHTSWYEDEDFTEDFSTDQFSTRYPQHLPRRGYRLNPRASRSLDPWSSTRQEEDEQEGPRARHMQRDPDRLSGSLRNPLVRRAPYLYEDDPLREEFAQQLENDPPITRRSSLYERYEDEDEY